MVTMNLLKKLVSIPGRNEPIPATSVEMIRGAIEGFDECRKGIENVRKAIKILDRLDDAVKAGNDAIVFEDAEFQMVYKAVDACPWTPVALHFPEFFEEIAALKAKRV